MANILVVEDEPQIGLGLQYNLQAEGHTVTWLESGEDAIQWMASRIGQLDLVILDVMLGDIDGLEVADKTRETGNFVPILMLTAKDLVQDRVAGLQAGADDYLTKPFALEELLARVNVLLRRQQWQSQTPDPTDAPLHALRFGINRVDFKTHDAQGPQGTLRLTALELEMLRYLAGRAGEVVSRHDLLENVWGVSGQVSTRTVDNFMVRLRRHFETDPRRPRHFISVRGVGYQFLLDPA